MRTVVHGLLVRNGFEVVQAADGADAEALFHTAGPFDALLTDIVMPGITQGPELARRLRESSP